MDEAIKIPVTKEFIETFFMNGEKHYEVKDGLTNKHKLIGIVQDTNYSVYYFLFVKGNTENMAFKIKTPEFLKLPKEENEKNGTNE